MNNRIINNYSRYILYIIIMISHRLYSVTWKSSMRKFGIDQSKGINLVRKFALPVILIYIKIFPFQYTDMLWTIIYT